jgi:hypothetical protein
MRPESGPDLEDSISDIDQGSIFVDMEARAWTVWAVKGFY